MNPEQALNELYKATRTISATADVHEHLKKCAEIIAQALQPEPPVSDEDLLIEDAD